MEEHVDRLSAIAQQLAGRVRDDDPEANGRWLLNLTTPEDRLALCFILAAAVPDDRPWAELVEWTGETAERRRRQWRLAQQRKRAA